MLINIPIIIKNRRLFHNIIVDAESRQPIYDHETKKQMTMNKETLCFLEEL